VTSQYGEHSDYGLLGYVCRQVLPFERNILPPSSGSTVKLKRANSSKTLIHINKSPHHHILVAYNLAFVLFLEVTRVPTRILLCNCNFLKSYQCPSSNTPRQEKRELSQRTSCCHQDVRKTKAK
jgi:hypothetical protein